MSCIHAVSCKLSLSLCSIVQKKIHPNFTGGTLMANGHLTCHQPFRQHATAANCLSLSLSSFYSLFNGYCRLVHNFSNIIECLLKVLSVYCFLLIRRRDFIRGVLFDPIRDQVLHQMFHLDALSSRSLGVVILTHTFAHNVPIINSIYPNM